MATLSDEIDDRPPIVARLKMLETEVRQLTSSKATTEQDGNDRSVALALERFGIRRLPVIRQYSSTAKFVKAKQNRSGSGCVFLLAIGPCNFSFQLSNRPVSP
jgi:hypothetical protein